MSDKLYTKKQGQYLAYIHTYTLIHHQPPARADMAEFFGVTPPSVVSMLNRLESRGLIAREPGVARSVRVLLAPEGLPRLAGPDEVAPDSPQPAASGIGLGHASSSEDLDSIYQLRIDLDNTRPPIWRRVLVPADITFGDLHTIIQAVMGWGGYHLHLFTAKGWEIGVPDFDEPWMSEFLEESLEVVSDYLSDAGDRVKYEYDFGDGWMHTIKLEKVTEADPKQHYPVCIKGRRACPPDDIGGPWGYTHLLEALGDPHHPDHDDMLAWVGEEFDAEAFSLEEANGRLGSVELIGGDRSRYLVGGPHVLTIRRWEMMAPDLPWATTMVTMLDDPPSDIKDTERRIQAIESPRALVEMLWDVTPWLIGTWSARVAGFGTRCIPFLVDAYEAVGRRKSIKNPDWYCDELVLVLARLGTPAIPALLQICATASQMSRTLICVALGRLGAHEHVDLIWEVLEDNSLADGTGGFMGPLWALIDLGDPRAAKVVFELLDGGFSFRELWAMLSHVGDARALIPLLATTALVSDEVQSELAFALAAIVRRVGREAAIEALQSLGETRAPNSTSLSTPNLVDVILASTEDEVNAHFRFYYQGPSQEDMVELVRRLIQHDWEYEDSDWAEAVDPSLFGDGPFYDYTDAFEDAEAVFALQGHSRAQHPPHSHFPNGRPVNRPGRNEPCWCGSGKKYKHCHWREDHLGDTG